MTYEEIDKEFDLLKEYMKCYIDSLYFRWTPIVIKSSDWSPQQIMDWHRQSGDLIFHNSTPEPPFEPLTFENWKKHERYKQSEGTR